MDLYIETSVWNICIDDELVNAAKRKVTERLFLEAQEHKHKIYISLLVLGEIARDPDVAHRASLQQLINRLRPIVLEDTEAVFRLGRAYVTEGIVPPKYEDDAVHIGHAVLNKLDAIISWNMGHIVKVRTRREIMRYNTENGLHCPDLATPEEVIEDVEDDETAS